MGVIRVLLVLLFLQPISFAHAQLSAEILSEARIFFEKYQKLEKTFDPALADLFADEAYIQTIKQYKNGTQRKIISPAPEYKEYLKQEAERGKGEGDSYTYTNLKFEDEHGAVRITATRNSLLHKYDAPFSILLLPNPEKGLMIYEQITIDKK